MTYKAVQPHFYQINGIFKGQIFGHILPLFLSINDAQQLHAMKNKSHGTGQQTPRHQLTQGKRLLKPIGVIKQHQSHHPFKSKKTVKTVTAYIPQGTPRNP
jgi:hypothetical protein